MKVVGTALTAALLSLAPIVAIGADTSSVDLSQPISADQAVKIALDRNFGIRLAEDQLGIQKSGRLAAYGEFFPSLNASWDYTHSKSTTASEPSSGFTPFPSEVDDRGYQINASQTLLSLASFLRISAASKNVGASEADVRGAQQFAAFSVKRQYYTLIESIKLLDVRREDLRLANEELRRTQSLFEVGSVARTDVLKAQVRVAEAQSALTAAENAEQLERSRLAQVLALPVTAPLQVLDNLEPQAETVDSAGAYGMAIENRPDLKAAHLRVTAAATGRKAAMARKLPFLTHGFTRSFNRSGSDQRIFFFDNDQIGQDTTFVRSSSNYWAYRIGFSWNILDGLVTASNVAQARAQQSLAEHEAEQLEIQVGLDVKDALLALRAARAQVASAREGLTSAEEDLKLSQERYTVGLGTILELIDAQVALTRARTAEVQAMAGVKIAEAQLDRAIGRQTW